VIAALDRLVRRASVTGLSQGARILEAIARRNRPSKAERVPRVGEDMPLSEEPFHFVASDRMHIPVGDLAAVDLPVGGAPQVVANVLGLVGATPSLPVYYSELQLQRRRARDRTMAEFYNVFDHRALSFFYRADVKYNWLLGYESEGQTAGDPVSSALLALEGFAAPSTRDRLSFPEALLVPLAGRLSDRRRPAGAIEATLRLVTGLPLSVRQAVPTWLPVPEAEQTRIGGPATRRFARLGGSMDGDVEGRPDSEPDAAMLGTAVLDVQHHYEIEGAPMSYETFLSCVKGGELLQTIRDVCRVATGIEQRPTLRLRIARDALPPLTLGNPEAPAVLGRTTWIGSVADREPVLDDCVMPITTEDQVKIH
jgi:type VI secretion system protein ImpH